MTPAGAAQTRAADIADLLVFTTLQRRATLGTSRFLCVDGRAGSGKTTLATAIATVAAGHCSTRLVRMDDIYEGWTGLDEVRPRVEEDLVAPLRENRPGRYQRYDWPSRSLAEWHQVAPADLLVLEGVGAGASAYADDITLLVWVDAPGDLRLERGLTRDGEPMRAEWLRWMDAEEALYAEELTRERADVIVDGTGRHEGAVMFV